MEVSFVGGGNDGGEEYCHHLAGVGDTVWGKKKKGDTLLKNSRSRGGLRVVQKERGASQEVGGER